MKARVLVALKGTYDLDIGGILLNSTAVGEIPSRMVHITTLPLPDPAYMDFPWKGVLPFCLELGLRFWI